jgi:hypothetical protein
MFKERFVLQLAFYREALSPESPLRLIITPAASQIDMLRPFVPRNGHVDRDPHRLTFEDLINLTCKCSGDDHVGRCMFLTDLLTTLGVSNCQI